MSCCKLYKIGCFESCTQIEFEIGLDEGDYILEIHFAEVSVNHTITVSSDGILNIDLSLFNESGCSDFKVYKPDESYLIKTYDDEEFECFRVEVKPSY